MARLRISAAHDGETRISSTCASQPTETTNGLRVKEPAHRNLRNTATISMRSDSEDNGAPIKLRPKSTTASKARGTQIRLGPNNKPNTLRDQAVDDLPASRKPRRHNAIDGARSRLPLDALLSTSASLLEPSNQPLDFRQITSAPEVDIEESIWCGSVDGSESLSEDELPSLRKLLSRNGNNGNDIPKSQALLSLTEQLDALSIFAESLDADINKPRKRAQKSSQEHARPVSSSDKENEGVIRFSPPRLKSPMKNDSLGRPRTPPQLLSPEKSKLKSPSKRNARVPTPPHRSSLDAFWTADAVNDWNDQYSPQKPLKSPRKLFFRQESDETSPTASPRKLKSPNKRSKADLEARKDFEARRLSMAESFFSELDEKITNGQIQRLTQSTGGVKIVWSKTLNSTAGRANWRRETTTTKGKDGETSSLHRHFASIDLATKVIDCEHRLLNVIAHEFCHLANFMVSGIKDQPHGRQFKEWGRLCSKTFECRGVEVTTKHSYQIEYKYVWQCTSEECAMEFKRHSKSIDTERHRCGGCKSSLVQIKPVPRRGAKQTQGTSETPTIGGTTAKAKAAPVTGYAAYVKQHFAALKKAMPGAPHKEVMGALGKQYRADKEAGRLAKPDIDILADAIVNDLEKIELGSSNDPVVLDFD